MEVVLNNGFCELSMDEMCEIDGGGGAWKAVKAFTGVVLVGFSPAVGVGVGIFSRTNCRSLCRRRLRKCWIVFDWFSMPLKDVQ